MLNLIDHLPRDSFYAQAVANDEEHAAAMVAADTGEKRPETGPPMSTWSAEVAVLADLVDAVNVLRNTLVAVNSKDGKGGKLVPYPRPTTVIDKVRKNSRKARHEQMVARVLPHKRTGD